MRSGTRAFGECMEKDLNIKLDKRFTAYGRLFGSLDKPLIIIVHGLLCNYREGLYMAAARWFARNGYAAFGFNLYGWKKGARQLIDCTLAMHTADLDAVVRYFRKKGVKKIFVVGHSFGGPTILSSAVQDFDAVTLWDPSYDISFTKKKYGYPGGKFVKALNGYFMAWGVNTVIGKAMAREIDTMTWDALTPKFKVPLHIIAAEKGVLVKGAKKYIAKANEPKKFEIVKGATHYFDDDEEMQERLFAITKSWLDKF